MENANCAFKSATRAHVPFYFFHARDSKNKDPDSYIFFFLASRLGRCGQVVSHVWLKIHLGVDVVTALFRSLPFQGYFAVEPSWNEKKEGILFVFLYIFFICGMDAWKLLQIPLVTLAYRIENQINLAKFVQIFHPTKIDHIESGVSSLMLASSEATIT